MIAVSSLDTNYNEIPCGWQNTTLEEFCKNNDLEVIEHDDKEAIVRAEWGNGEGYDTFRITLV